MTTRQCIKAIKKKCIIVTVAHELSSSHDFIECTDRNVILSVPEVDPRTDRQENVSKISCSANH